jgi:hypothetical protein
VPDNKDTAKPAIPNKISDHTGQFDTRFLLWRAFCAENGVPVETMPSELTGDTKDKWDKLKDEQLPKPTEKK